MTSKIKNKTFNLIKFINMEQVNKAIKVLELEKFNDNKVIKTISQKTKVKAEYITLALFVIGIVFFLLVGIGQKITLLTVSFLYPAFKSF